MVCGFSQRIPAPSPKALSSRGVSSVQAFASIGPFSPMPLRKRLAQITSGSSTTKLQAMARKTLKRFSVRSARPTRPSLKATRVNLRGQARECDLHSSTLCCQRSSGGSQRQPWTYANRRCCYAAHPRRGPKRSRLQRCWLHDHPLAPGCAQ